jgi:hypothetical protein
MQCARHLGLRRRRCVFNKLSEFRREIIVIQLASELSGDHDHQPAGQDQGHDRLP